jgi:hypothetical protein
LHCSRTPWLKEWILSWAEFQVELYHLLAFLRMGKLLNQLSINFLKWKMRNNDSRAYLLGIAWELKETRYLKYWAQCAPCGVCFWWVPDSITWKSFPRHSSFPLP